MFTEHSLLVRQFLKRKINRQLPCTSNRTLSYARDPILLSPSTSIIVYYVQLFIHILMNIIQLYYIILFYILKKGRNCLNQPVVFRRLASAVSAGPEVNT